MDWKQFVLKLLDEGREYVKLMLPVIMAYLLPSPLKKKPGQKEEG